MRKIFAVAFVLMCGCSVPTGHVGIQSCMGNVSETTLDPGGPYATFNEIHPISVTPISVTDTIEENAAMAPIVRMGDTLQTIEEWNGIK
jgi:hypothetical protein